MFQIQAMEIFAQSAFLGNLPAGKNLRQKLQKALSKELSEKGSSALWPHDATAWNLRNYNNNDRPRSPNNNHDSEGQDNNRDNNKQG